MKHRCENLEQMLLSLSLLAAVLIAATAPAETGIAAGAVKVSEQSAVRGWITLVIELNSDKFVG